MAAADNYDRQAFLEWLQSVKSQEYRTARDNACMVGTFLKSGKGAEKFVKSYTKPNSYNNARNAVNHYLDYLGQARLALKQKQRLINALIIAPKSAEIIDIVHRVKPLGVKTYLALCGSVGLRPQRLLKMNWAEVDFENAWIKINERHGKKRKH